MSPTDQFYKENKELFYKMGKITIKHWDSLVEEWFKSNGYPVPINQRIYKRIYELCGRDRYYFIKRVVAWSSDDQKNMCYNVFTKHACKPYLDVFPKRENEKSEKEISEEKEFRKIERKIRKQGFY